MHNDNANDIFDCPCETGPSELDWIDAMRIQAEEDYIHRMEELQDAEDHRKASEEWEARVKRAKISGFLLAAPDERDRTIFGASGPAWCFNCDFDTLFLAVGFDVDEIRKWKKLRVEFCSLHNYLTVNKVVGGYLTDCRQVIFDKITWHPLSRKKGGPFLELALKEKNLTAIVHFGTNTETKLQPVTIHVFVNRERVQLVTNYTLKDGVLVPTGRGLLKKD